MRVLVTGASGLIGRVAVKELVRRGHEVRTLQRGPLPPELAGAEALQADVTSPAGRWAAEAADGVLHLAGRGDVMESWASPEEYLWVIARGTLNVLNGARASNAVVVLPSSQRVYRMARRPLRETDPPRPTDPYAVAKVAAEAYCRIYAERYRLPTRVVRLFSVYGPGQRGYGSSGVAAIFLRRARENQDLLVEAGPRRDLTYVTDAARGLVAALEQARPGFRVYNIATGQGTALPALADTIVRLTRSQSRIVTPGQPWRSGDLVADISRARRELGYAPQVTLDEGLRRLVAGEMAEAQ